MQQGLGASRCAGPGHSRAEPEEVSALRASVPLRVPNIGGLRHWTRAEEQALIDLRGNGLSRAEIAAELRRSHKAVKTRLEMVRELGLMR